MEFNNFKTAVQRQFNVMKEYKLFTVDTNKDVLWETYLKSFPEGTNPIYRERTEHDCNCCKSFIRTIGNMVAIIHGEVVSLWDVNVGGHYQVVADALSGYVKEHAIENTFLHTEKSVGTDKNHVQTENGITTWEHFYLQLPKTIVVNKEAIGTRLSEVRTTHDMVYRALTEITVEALETVSELIAQNSLYRGQEHVFVVDSFRKIKREFDKLPTDKQKQMYCWTLTVPDSVARIRNTVIGTLLVDLSEGKDIDVAVTSFESKVAPTNYKRPTALVTKAMIEKAQQTVEELGLTASLDRRFAVLEDITINNVLFADRSAKKRMGGVFDDLVATVPEKTKNFDKVETVTIDTFLTNILPKAESIEIMVENKHVGNFVSLIAPCDLTAKGLFKWPNNFSWCYAGELTDSIKERVKRAGGSIEGDLCCRLSWFNYDDLDFHMKEPKRYEIYFVNKGRRSSNGGMLDVDMNAGGRATRTPVENIFYASRNTMHDGVYNLSVHNFCKRETIDVGFEVEVEFDGTTYNFHYDKAVRDKEIINVATITYKNNKFSIDGAIPLSVAPKTVWGIQTQTFHKVNVITHSPNYWNDKTVGNKHYFFMLEDCKNDGKARGFFNEFLTEELTPHRKVLEIVGAKMKTAESDNQLSGLGFSSTQRNEILCRVSGKFNRTIKITF